MSERLEGLDFVTVPCRVCRQCGNKWFPVSFRLREIKPKRCPKCQSYNWEKEPDAKQPYHRLMEKYGEYLRAYNPRRDGAMLTMGQWRERAERERLERKRGRLAGGDGGEVGDSAAAEETGR